MSFYKSSSLHVLNECQPCKFRNGPENSNGNDDQELEHKITVTLPIPQKKLIGVAKVAAQSIIDTVSGTFEELYDQPLSEILPKLPDLQLEKKKSPSEKKKRVRAIENNVRSAMINGHIHIY